MKKRNSESKLGIPTPRVYGPDHPNYVHGLSGRPDYNRWSNMMSRCYSESSRAYRYYGGRGIKVCEEWHDPKNFLEWIDENLGPCPPHYTIERIDNDGDYEPGNVRWASRTEQNRNKRKKGTA